MEWVAWEGFLDLIFVTVLNLFEILPKKFIILLFQRTSFYRGLRFNLSGEDASSRWGFGFC